MLGVLGVLNVFHVLHVLQVLHVLNVLHGRIVGLLGLVISLALSLFLSRVHAPGDTTLIPLSSAHEDDMGASV